MIEINEKILISLILSENNSIDIKFGIDENVDKICNDLSEKYNLTDGVKIKLKLNIENHISEEILRRKRDAKTKNQLNKNTIDRLYYKSIENQKNKIQCTSNLKEKIIMKGLEEHCFSPKITFYPKTFGSERKFLKIEDKLIKQGQISKEKKLMKKITDDINFRENIAKERMKNELSK